MKSLVKKYAQRLISFKQRPFLSVVILCCRGSADILTFKLGGFFAFVSVRGLPFPSYLLYADDILLFCAASISNAKEILKILKDYAEISGQFHNPDKTSRRSSLALDSLIGISFIVYNGSWLSKPNYLSTTTSLTSSDHCFGIPI